VNPPAAQRLSDDSRLVTGSLGTMLQMLIATRDFLDRHGQLTSPSEAAQAVNPELWLPEGPHWWRLVPSRNVAGWLALGDRHRGGTLQWSFGTERTGPEDQCRQAPVVSCGNAIGAFPWPLPGSWFLGPAGNKRSRGLDARCRPSAATGASPRSPYRS
jgi:hypothetical protein